MSISDKDGKQVKGNFAQDGHYYDGELGHLTTESFVTTGDNHWYYVDKTGEKSDWPSRNRDKTYHFNDKGASNKRGKEWLLMEKDIISILKWRTLE